MIRTFKVATLLRRVCS